MTGLAVIGAVQALMHSEPYVHSLGALTGNMAMQQVVFTDYTPNRICTASLNVNHVPMAVKARMVLKACLTSFWL